jgi:hypothetical protein
VPIILAPGAPTSWDFHVSHSGADVYFGCQPDPSGVQFIIERPDGWDSPELRTDEQDIPLEDGADIGTVLFGKRILVLTGTILAPDPPTLEVARRRLLRALRPLSDDGVFEGNDDDGVRRFCRVRRSGKPSFTRLDAGVYQFSAQLVAGDPRKYSTVYEQAQVPVQTSTNNVGPSAGAGKAFRYYDTTAVVAAATAATDYAGLTAAIAPMMATYDMAVQFHTSSGTGLGGIVFTAITTFADAKQDVLWLLDEMAKYPVYYVRSTKLQTVHLVGSGTVNGGSFGGVTTYTGTDYYAITSMNSNPDAVKGTFHHEFFHVAQFTWPADIAAMQAAWLKQNPPGFVYGTHPSFTGDHPPGFMEDYGRTNITEDQATFAAARLGDEGWARTNTYIADDPRVAAKTALLVAFLAAHSNQIMADPYLQMIHTVPQLPASSGPGVFPWHRPFQFSGPISRNTIPLVNGGDLATPLVIDLVGPLTDPLLIETTGTGMRIGVSAVIPQNRVLQIDGQRRTAMIDSTSYLGQFTADSTPLRDLQLPPGGGTAWRLIAAGSGHALLTASDAWE